MYLVIRSVLWVVFRCHWWCARSYSTLFSGSCKVSWCVCEFCSYGGVGQCALLSWRAMLCFWRRPLYPTGTAYRGLRVSCRDRRVVTVDIGASPYASVRLDRRSWGTLGWSAPGMTGAPGKLRRINSETLPGQLPENDWGATCLFIHSVGAFIVIIDTGR